MWYDHPVRALSLIHGVALGIVGVGCNTNVGVEDPFDSVSSESSSGDPGTDSTGGEDDTTSTTESGTGVDSSSSSSESTEDEGSGSICGDGYITGMEECDCGGIQCQPDGLDQHTCLDVDVPNAPGLLTGGELSCDPGSCRFDVSGCTFCGDGMLNGNEECEADTPIEQTCKELGKGTAGTVMCGTSCTIDTSACTLCGYELDFSDCDDGWTTGRTDPMASIPSWACGDPSGDPPYGPPGAVTGVWATDLTESYSSNESSFLMSPAFDFGKCEGEQMTMTLTHWYNFESGGDGGIVQVSTNGADWTTLEPTGGSLYDDGPISATFPPVQGSAGFHAGAAGDDSASMLESEFDLSAYAGQQDIRIRFVFGSDNGTVAPGWYVDALSILGSG